MCNNWPFVIHLTFKTFVHLFRLIKPVYFLFIFLNNKRFCFLFVVIQFFFTFIFCACSVFWIYFKYCFFVCWLRKQHKKCIRFCIYILPKFLFLPVTLIFSIKRQKEENLSKDMPF